MLIRMLALSLLAPLLLLAACGDDDDAKTNTPRPAGATTAAGGASSTTAPGEGGSPGPKDIKVTAKDFSFEPANITVAPGQGINLTLKNEGQAKHSFTIGDEDIAEAEGGETGQSGFTAPDATTEFHCEYHPTQMTGTITVSDFGASNPNATAAGGVSGFGY